MANPKVADAVEQVRLFTKDADGEKWDDEAVLTYLNTAMRLLYQRHPLAFCVTAPVVAEPDALTMTGEIAVLPRFVEPLAHYAAAQCLIEGADDEFNARLAKTHLELFESLSA